MNTRKRKRILQILESIAFTDLKDICVWKENKLQLRPTEEISKQSLHAIAEIKESSTGIQLKLYSKLKALDILAKYYGLYDANTSNDDNSAEHKTTPLDVFYEWINTANDTI